MSRRIRTNGDLESYVEHFRSRVLQDALVSATRSYWLKRAEAFEAAQHRPGDFVGLCSVEQIEAANRELAEKARACRNRAELALLHVDDVDVPVEGVA